ncbi:MAG: GNAT family N-acetyltransferase [bacterium]|nr:GNAT family N-acetyltransferase [bacterium]
MRQMKAEIATPEHFAILNDAFERLRDQRRQRCVDYLADPGIADFHRDRLVQSIRSEKIKAPWILYDTGGALAVFGIEASPFHSDHYGVPYYKIQPFYSFCDDDESAKAITAEIVKRFDGAPGSVYTARIDGDASALGYWMEDAGFLSVGASVRLSIKLNLNKSQIDNGVISTYDTLNIRPAEPGDCETLQRIGAESHEHSHFFREKRFSKEKTQALFAKWLGMSLDRLADRVFIAEMEGRIAGFCSLFYNASLQPYTGKRIGVIDFIVVDPAFQGAGAGSKLIESAIDWFSGKADILELRTMAENLKAIRFYQKNGFRLLSTDFHYHYWKEER